MLRIREIVFSVVFAVAVAVSARTAARAGDALAAPPVYGIAPDGGSTLTFKAFKEGWFSSLGHDHTVAGRAFAVAERFDPEKVEAASVTFTVRTADLEVLDPAASADDRAKIAKTLRGDEVLDVARYPDIRFASTAAKVLERRPDGRLRLAVTGDLTLHGATKPIEFEVSLEPAADASGPLKATGTISLDQSRFGITPYAAALGAVKVKDHVELDFTILAGRAGGEEAR